MNATPPPAATDRGRSPLRRAMTHTGKRVLHWIDRMQVRHSLIPTDPFLDNTLFDWVPRLEAAYPAIRAELERVMERPEEIPSFHQISPDQDRISKGNNWKTFGFFVFGQPVGENCRRCPDTAAALRAVPGLQNAMFSILAPRYHIPPHKGPTRALVRCHLALKVPADGERCWIRVRRFFNQTVIRLIRASSYARKPLANLKAWHRPDR